MADYLLDTEFLNDLFLQQHQEKYVRITALDREENPVETIEGVITNVGSINLDGESKMQRTSNLSFSADLGSTITDYYWTLRRKFQLEIGLKNNINDDYPNICWFKMGIFVITGFNYEINITNISVSISGKDKMCLLDGSIGGTLPAQIDFGKRQIIDDDGFIHYEMIPIKEIIIEALRAYSQEPLRNIILNDIDDYGYELFDYRGNEPLYFLKKVEDGKIINYVIDPKFPVWIGGNNKTIISDPNITYLSTAKLNDTVEATEVTLSEESSNLYNIIKIEYGETCGYHKIPLYFPTDLVLEAGNSVTNLLDKIVETFEGFEYFYDIYGRFVFQKKKNYLYEVFTPFGNNASPDIIKSSYIFKFTDSSLFTAISNIPTIENIKNDYTVWAKKRGVNDNDVPIHARFAVDKKPVSYISPYIRTRRGIYYKQKFIKQSDFGEYKLQSIYLEQDQFKNCYIRSYYGGDYSIDNTDEGSGYLKVGDYYIPEANVILYNEDGSIVSKPEEGEAYYLHLSQYNSTSRNDDWRELIYQMAVDWYQHAHDADFEDKIKQANPSNYPTGRTGYEQYYIDLQGFWRQLYNPYPNDEDADKYDTDHWSFASKETPEQLYFWFDFLDSGGPLGRFSVKEIGDRFLVESNPQGVDILYNREAPGIQFIFPDDDFLEVVGDKPSFQATDNMRQLFTRSTQGKSCLEKINENLNNKLLAAETINLTCVPLYNLKPNTKIYVKNEEANLDGDYIINKITIPMEYNGLMQLTASKIIDFRNVNQMNYTTMRIKDKSNQTITDEQNKIILSIEKGE